MTIEWKMRTHADLIQVFYSVAIETPSVIVRMLQLSNYEHTVGWTQLKLKLRRSRIPRCDQHLLIL